MAKIVHYEEFNTDIPTIIYIHGFFGDGENDESVKSLKEVFLKSKKENFVTIDWSDYSKITFGVLPYLENMPDLNIICKNIAKQLEVIRKTIFYKEFYLVGHSLGGQCAGLVGRHLKEISNNKFIIPRIYALDPAGPYFEREKIHFECIKKSDAAYVQIIHTNAASYGLAWSVGHSDFYPNGGWTQPGCYTNMCSHKFAWILFRESVRYEGSFIARKCSSSGSFVKGLCESNEISYMGYSRNRTLPYGNFYLSTRTDGNKLSKGYDGIKPKEFQKTLGQFTQNVTSFFFNFFYGIYDAIFG